MRKSPVWVLSKKEFQELVNKCSSRVEVLEKLGLNGYSGSHRTLKLRIDAEQINIDHILKNYQLRSRIANIKNTIPLEKILVLNSTYKASGSVLKKRLLKENLLKDECSVCGQLPLWNNQPLSLQLDHINGIHSDNRIENLRVLCPHCHSQTPTFSGRKNKKKRSR